MLRERRRGDSVASQAAPWSKVTARVRRLIDDVHDGSLLEASAHAGVPYATLREMHSGRRRRPDFETLGRLARTYGLPLEWFFEGSAADDGTVPQAGWAGLVPEPGPGPAGRRVTIPYSAWPLIRVLVQLEQRLRDRPVCADRPIIGAATDPREIRRRILAFLFQPLEAARSAAGEATGLAPAGASDAALRELGRFWERALASLLPDLVSPESIGEVA
ncbi:MAG: helix-turn-helix domain-containing protein [Gemmatimonadales bacterium]